MSARGRRWEARSAVALALLVLSACSGSGTSSNAIASLGELPDAGPVPATTEPAPKPPSSRQERCDREHLATVSYFPDDQPIGFIEHLRSLGQIRVGVDENTQGLSARDPLTGKFEGFEVDLADLIVRKVLGDSYTPQSLVFVPLLTDEKTPAVANQTVDMTISAVSMSCSRWEQVDFSSEYYTAHQKFLVRSDSNIRSREDLAESRVCVTNASSSATIMGRVVPEAELLLVPARTDCLLALEQGDADAYFGHDTFLYGMHEQDPTMVIRDLLDPEDTVSHYGIAINRQHPELTRFVNDVLRDAMDDGTWRALSKQWLVDPYDAPDIDPPQAERWREPGD